MNLSLVTYVKSRHQAHGHPKLLTATHPSSARVPLKVIGPARPQGVVRNTAVTQAGSKSSSYRAESFSFIVHLASSILNCSLHRLRCPPLGARDTPHPISLVALA